jgi:hypothetical protein
MSQSRPRAHPPAPTSPTRSLFEAALARLRHGRAARSVALGGSVLVALPPAAACHDAVETRLVESFDWAQYEGKRDTGMVSFTGHWYAECASPNTRFGCGDLAMHFFVRVKPQAHADLDWKRVGVVFRSPSDMTERTAVGHYQFTYGNGDEEWRVTIQVPQWQSVIVFDAWYQDGAGSTWIDDNEGEFHVVNAGPAYNVVRTEPWLQTVTVTEAGVGGRLSAQVADLDFDKQLELVATKDGWQTVLRFGIGAAGDKNKWYWVEDFPYSNRERWHIDLDLPGGADRFEFAVGYKHGVVNGAKVYEFWDNNGGSNYRVERGEPQP